MSQTYEGGMPAVIARYEARRAPLGMAPGEALPPADCDLAALATQIVGDPAQDPAEAPPFRSAHHRKRFAIRQELTGRSELAALCALLIAHLRKRSFPPQVPILFQRLWAEHAAHLLDQLDLRWQVSAVTTFGDHGVTPAQRACGLGLSTLFGMMKLSETERQFSGLSADQPFAPGQRRAGPLPLGMDAYALADGGLDVNLIARLWQEASEDVVLRPLAHHLLRQVIDDPRTVFHRLKLLRDRRAARQPAKAAPVAPAPGDLRLPAPATPPRWGLVTTTNAPLSQIVDFTAWHLAQGAARLVLWLDRPAPEVHRALGHLGQVMLIDAHDGPGRARRHQVRQVRNATRSLQAMQDLDWLGHIDIDEILLPGPQSVADHLAALPAEALCARMRPVEVLAPAPDQPADLHLFKATLPRARDRAAPSEACFPLWGRYLPGGFLSHLSGKVFVRCGLPAEAELRIHMLRLAGVDNPAKAELAPLELGHLHAPSWEAFEAHLRYRRDQGSYRAGLKPPAPDGPGLTLHQILDTVEAEGGTDALRAFYEELSRAIPALCDRLAAHGLLRRHHIDWPEVRQRFGLSPLPPDPPTETDPA